MIEMKARQFIRSSELARRAGVSTDTLRHYERKGIIPAPLRSPNGYREYPPRTLDRVMTVQRALRVGFKLDDLARVFRERDAGGRPCREVRQLAGARLEEVETQIEDLLVLRGELREILDKWDAVLARTPESEQSHLLHSLGVRGLTTRTRPQLNGRKLASRKLARRSKERT